MSSDQIAFYKSTDKGAGLPFGIIGHKDLQHSKEILIPSLRDFHVIFWFKKGTGTYFIDFQEYQFQPNTLALLSKDQVHYFLPFDPVATEIQSIVFRPDFIYRNDRDLLHLFQFTVANHIEGVQILNLGPQEESHLQTISNQMHVVFEQWSGSSRDNAFYHWLSLFLIHCEKLQIQCEEDLVIDENQKLLLHFNQLLESNFRQEYKVEFYTGALGVPTKALSKLTQQRYKLSPKAVIDERRILEIKRRLTGTTDPTKKISYDLGFDEPTNMVKYFKKHTGQTPTAFRAISTHRD